MEGGKQKHPIFNGEWEIMSSLGEGNTSKVYLAKNMKDGKQVALKLLREEFLQRDQDSIKSVEQEIQILQGLKHNNIVNIMGYGSDGTVLKPSGRKIENLVYILLEYVTGGLLFDLCQSMGGMGEDYGRFFLNQICDVVGYMQGKGVVHRDLKLENILVDDSMNLKVADFGFATYKKINKLQSYRGTMTYMAPEIKEGKTYDGKQIDMFSCGVILFIIIQGIFPFKEAKKDEYFYNLIINNKLDTYWQKVGGQNLSDDFKDLILKMFAYDGSKRPTVDEIRKHPWMKPDKLDVKGIRNDLLERLSEARSQRTADSSNAAGSVRGDDKKEFIRGTAALQLQKFNDNTDFDCTLYPGVVIEKINEFIEGANYSKDKKPTVVENKDKKWVKITRPEVVNKEKPEEGQDYLQIKVKFFMIEDLEEDEHRMRVQFKKKKGDLHQFYDLLKDMKENYLQEEDKEILCAMREHQQEAKEEVAKEEPKEEAKVVEVAQ